MFQGKVRLISNIEVMPSVNLIEVEAPEIASAAQAGQFVMITCDSGNTRLLRRPISIQGVKDRFVSFLFARVGEGTEWLAGRQAGRTPAGLQSAEYLDLMGPMGRGFTLLPRAQQLLLVAGGMGIAPLCFLADQALSQGRRVKILIGAKTASLVIPTLFLPQNAYVITTTEDGTAGIKGLVTSLLPEHLPQADQVFICGPLPMYQAIRRNYVNHLLGLPVEVSLEVRMGCGLGFCYACTIKTTRGLKQVCKDGPVFPFGEVVWGEL